MFGAALPPQGFAPQVKCRALPHRRCASYLQSRHFCGTSPARRSSVQPDGFLPQGSGDSAWLRGPDDAGSAGNCVLRLLERTEVVLHSYDNYASNHPC